MSAKFDALDKAIEAGGANLSASAIVTKKLAFLVEDLCAENLLTKSGADKKAKYSVTAEGRAEWEKQASEERRQAIRQREAAAQEEARRREAQVQEETKRREEEKQKKTLLALLETVQTIAGKKALSAAQLKKFPPATITAACEQKLIEPAGKANAYLLLEGGEAALLATKPLEEQIATLRQKQADQVKHWRAASKTLSEELAAADGADDGGLLRQGAEACAAFDAVIAEMSGFARVVELAKRYRERMAAATEHASKAAEGVMEARDQASRLSELIEAVERRLGERLAALKEQAAARPAPVAEAPAPPVPAVPPPPPPAPAGPTEAEVWEATKATYQEVRDANARIGGIVTVPELTDRIRRAFPTLTVPVVHALLQKWHGDDRFTLQVCNNPHLEERASEGIESVRGLLFYVQFRS